MPSVHVLPDDKTFEVKRGDAIFDACRKAGIPIQSDCGNGRTCGKCVVKVVKGDVPIQLEEENLLHADELKNGYRLLCMIEAQCDLTIEVPEASRPVGGQILTGGLTADGRQARRPNVEQIYVEQPAPTLQSPGSNFGILEKGLGARASGLKAGIEQLREMQRVMEASDFRFTVTLCGDTVLRTEPGDTRGTACGLAYDIGTTTVVGYLMRLDTGEELAVASRLNPQSACGHDVIARAEHAGKGEEQRKELQQLIVDCTQEIAEECCAKVGVSIDACYEVTVGGNTVMMHLLFGVDPHPITVSPFTPAWTRSLEVPARDVGMRLHPESRIYVLPAVAGYIGGDITAGLLAIDLASSEDQVLFVDIGTNGEIVLGNRDGWAACACAAGPAFEGARISCGMPAVSGAIDQVAMDPSGEDLNVHCLGDEAARGLCGTGLIDAVAMLLQSGVVDPQGRVVDEDEAEGLPSKLAQRILPDKVGQQVRLVTRDETLEKRRDLTLTQRDVRELQLAKGAIRAGVDMLLKVRGVAANEVGRVLIAGGFGNFIRPASALAIGLFSEAFDVNRIEFVGNTAGLGAKICLVNVEAREQVERLAERTEYVELSGRRDFQEVYMDAMVFPEETVEACTAG